MNGDLRRIARGLRAAAEVLEDFTPGQVEATRKAGGSPVTEADQRIDDVLSELLPIVGEGWLSEESVDGADRLDCRRVWVVDPLDGTREFIEGIPEWCVSIGLVEDGRPVAGGILNPLTGETFLGSPSTGVTLNGQPVQQSPRTCLQGAVVLASRSEVQRGQWRPFEECGIEVVAMGSVAYKLARVAAGLADATWTLVPKNEWDIAAGVALILAQGGSVRRPDGKPCRFNRPKTLYPGLIASGAGLAAPIEALIEERTGARGVPVA